MQRLRSMGWRGLCVATTLGLAAAGLLATTNAGSASATSRRARAVRAAGTKLPGYTLITGDAFQWIFPLQNVTNYDPGEQDVEENSFLPLYFVGKGTRTGVDAAFSIGERPVYSDGDTTVTFHLKPGYTWSDGQKVTSRDVEFFFQLDRVGKHTLGSWVKGDLPTDVRSEAYPSASTVVLHLTHAVNPTWFTGNQLTWIYPLPAQAWDRTCATCPVNDAAATSAGAKKVFHFLMKQSSSLTTYATNPLWKTVDGPFVINAYDAATHDTTFVANRRYTGPTRPRIPGFRIFTYTTGLAEIDALRSGALTFGYLPLSDISEGSYLEKHGFTVKSWKLFYNEDMQFGYTSKKWGPLVRQLYIRQALQHLVTERLYISKALHGYGVPDYGVVSEYPGSSDVSPGIRRDPDPYSVSAAKRLLAAHGWKEGSAGVDVCARAGTGPSACGAGIAKGRSLSFPFLYQTGTTSFLAEVSAFETAAKSAGVGVDLRPESITTLYSIAGVCPTTPCNYGLAGYANFMWNYGQNQSVPTGDDQFGKGNFFGGGYFTRTAQRLIDAADRTAGRRTLYADQNYLSKNVASLWWPLEDYVVVVKKGLTGWKLSPYGTVIPTEWHLSAT